MQRFLIDPCDCRLLKCNQPKKEKKTDKKDNEKKEGAGGGGGVAMPNGMVSNYFFAGPAFYNPPACFGQFVHGYPQIPFPQIVVQQAPEKKKDPQPHVCVACNAKNKCKKCLKAEEEAKHYVVKQSFSNPRGSYRPSIFSNKVYRSD